VQRRRQRYPAVGVLHADVTATLARDRPSGAFEGLDEALARDDREPSLNRSHRDREFAANHASVERTIVFAQSLDVELQSFLGVGHRLCQRVALSVQAGEIGA
jgi:hypothetical protein